MLNRVHQALTLPSFEDEEKMRVARLLYGMLVAGICLNVIDAFLLGIFAPETLSTFWINGALLIATVMGFVLLRRGQVRAASLILCLSLWVLLTIYFAISGGVASPAFGFLNLVIIVGAVLLDVRGAVIFGILCIATTIVLYVAGANGLLTLTETMPTDQRLFATQTAILLSLAVLMGIGARSVRDALARSQTSERNLAERNRELESEIAERKRVEERLLESEEELRQLSDAALEGIVITDQGKIIMANKRIAGMLGYDHAELIGKSVLDFVAPESRDLVLQHIQSGYDEPYDHVAIRKDGSTFPIEVIGRMMSYQGKPVRVTALRDITERKQVEAALLRSEERFFKAFHANPGALTISTIEDGRFIDVNESFLKLFGYTREEVIGATALELQTWADPNDRTKLIKLIREHGPVQQLEARFRKKSGDTGDVLYSVETIELDGEIHLLFMLQDITERKRAEERFYKAFHANPSPISISTIQEGRFVDVNESFLKFTGYRRDEILGKTALELRFWETSEERIEALRILEEDGMIRQMPAQLLAKSGEMRYGSTSMEVIEIAGEAHLLSMIQDFTDLKLAEKQALDLAFAAERAENMKEFLSTISHDLKTPLSVMNTSLYMLERIDDPEKQRDKINTLKRQTELLEKYIQDILTMTRLDHTPVLVRQPVNLNRLLRDIEQRLRPSLEQKNLTTLMDLNQDILPVLGDENELDRVMVNLFENAVNYTPNNGSVTVRTIARGSSTVTEIVDSGIGIQQSDLSRIFDRFYRASEAQRASTRGTGLGLAIVKKIVALHAGSIEVESEVGKGSTFRVSLPVDTRGIDEATL